MKNIVFIIFIIIVLLVIIITIFHGLFNQIVIKKEKVSEFTIVYVKHIGDYSKSSAPMNDLYYKLVNLENIETYKGFGIYYDNPSSVSKNELRSVVGCILEEKDFSKIPLLKSKGYRIAVISENESYVVNFPYKSPFSIFIGLLKVYPKINEFKKVNEVIENPITEIYDIKNKNIMYSLNNGIENKLFERLLSE